MKRGKEACKTPRLAPRRFEEMVVGKIRSNILTDSNIRALVKVVDEQMDGVAGEHRKRLETITAYAQDMRRFLKKIELTERRTFIESFVKETVVTPDNALMRYTVPMPEDSLAPGMSAEDMALNGSVLSTVPVGGPRRTDLRAIRWEVRT